MGLEEATAYVTSSAPGPPQPDSAMPATVLTASTLHPTRLWAVLSLILFLPRCCPVCRAALHFIMSTPLPGSLSQGHCDDPSGPQKQLLFLPPLRQPGTGAKAEVQTGTKRAGGTRFHPNVGAAASEPGSPQHRGSRHYT